MKIQIWAPGLNSASLMQALSLSQLRPQLLSDPSAVHPDHPIHLCYSDPLAWCVSTDFAASTAGVTAVLAALPAIVNSGVHCRLVNLSCANYPTLVAWCVDPSSPPSSKSPPRFAEPDPFEALLAIAWLQEHPEQLQAYQALEAHPLAAALDGRPPDLDCLGRYQQAANLDALLVARQERAALEADLAELAEQLAPLQEQQLEALALREQLALLQARLQQADVLQERCSELQLSLQAQQLDLEQLARRLALLEQLVSAGSDASQRLQGRLAQALA